jgi:hypothetical protein
MKRLIYAYDTADKARRREPVARRRGRHLLWQSDVSTLTAL